jgi:DNA primase
MQYLERNNCLHALHDRLAKIMYDPKQNRTVFVVQDDSQVYDAIGRSFSNRVLPKWYRYGNSSKLFTCGDHDTAILVEDAASACAVSQVSTGVALLGTNLKDADLTPLRKYKHVYICLDADATRKSLDIQKYLAYFVSCNVVRLKDDLKYFNKEEIKRLVWNSN